MWIKIQYRWEPIKIQYKANLYPVASYPGYQRASGGEIILHGMIEEGSGKRRKHGAKHIVCECQVPYILMTKFSGLRPNKKKYEQEIR